jgi:hypothetical protein
MATTLEQHLMATTLEQHLARLYHSRYHSTTYLVPSFLTEMLNHHLNQRYMLMSFSTIQLCSQPPSVVQLGIIYHLCKLALWSRFSSR